MAVLLPALPRLADVKPALRLFGVQLVPVLGGPEQRAGRLGSRYQIDVTMPALARDCAAAWVGARLKAAAEDDFLRLTWPEADGPQAWGAGVTDGGGQLGTTLAVRGLTAGAVIPQWKFFSLLYPDGYRLHATTEAVTAGDDGKAILSIAPALRRSASDGMALHAPTADVFPAGQLVDWDLQLKRWTTFSFVLSEYQ